MPDEGMESITKALASNQSLTLRRLKLDCDCTFTDTAAHCLAQFITNTTTLQHLIISFCTFSATELLEQSRAIHHNSSLQEWKLEDCDLIVDGDDEASNFAQLFEYPDMMENVVYFCMEESPLVFTTIGDRGAESIANVLERSAKHFYCLDLSNNNISDTGATAIAQALLHTSIL